MVDRFQVQSLSVGKYYSKLCGIIKHGIANFFNFFNTKGASQIRKNDEFDKINVYSRDLNKINMRYHNSERSW